MNRKLGEKDTELQAAYIISSESYTRLLAYLAYQQLKNCLVYEIVSLVNHMADQNRSYAPDQIARFQIYVDFLLDKREGENPFFEFCSNNNDAALLGRTLGVKAGESAGERLTDELGLNSAECIKFMEAFFDNEEVFSERIGELTGELMITVYQSDAWRLVGRLLGSNVPDLELVAKALGLDVRNT